MPLLTLQRFKFAPDGTLGRLLINGRPDGYTVEDEIRNVKVHGETAIPFGSYPFRGSFYTVKITNGIRKL